jgi:hypothetical protein
MIVTEPPRRLCERIKLLTGIASATLDSAISSDTILFGVAATLGL